MSTIVIKILFSTHWKFGEIKKNKTYCRKHKLFKYELCGNVFILIHIHKCIAFIIYTQIMTEFGHQGYNSECRQHAWNIMGYGI